MDISGISSLSSSARSPLDVATGEGINQAISVSVMKQAQNAEKQQAQSIVKMIEDSTPRPTASGTGSIINIGA
jgi:hypothetical protein